MVQQINIYMLLQPPEVPNWKYKSISMDFIVSLLKTQIGYNRIFVIIVQFTKIAHFIPLVTTNPTYGVANLFMKNIF